MVAAQPASLWPLGIEGGSASGARREGSPCVTIESLACALAYYHANQAEIVAELATEAEEAAKLEADFEESDSPLP